MQSRSVSGADVAVPQFRVARRSVADERLGPGNHAAWHGRPLPVLRTALRLVCDDARHFAVPRYPVCYAILDSADPDQGAASLFIFTHRDEAA